MQHLRWLLVGSSFDATRCCLAAEAAATPPTTKSAGHKDYQEIWDGNQDEFDGTDSSEMQTCKVRVRPAHGVDGGPDCWPPPPAWRMCSAKLGRWHPSIRRRCTCVRARAWPVACLIIRLPSALPASASNLQSWFDDRVECRNALSKLPYLTGVKDLKRDYLPWTR